MLKRFIRFLALGLAITTIAGTIARAQDVFITEFVAANDTGLTDEDGEFSDWIELYNATSQPVNLGGWYLTDAASNLQKWRLPATNLPPYSYLVVFASNKDRRVPGAPLHTNFRLAGDGEFLALVRTNGTTIESQYAPRYPDQRPNTSYGLGMLTGPYSMLVPTGATAKVLVPTADLGTAWTAIGFDDASWLSGPTGVGFDNGTNYGGVIATDLAASMLNSNASAFIRLPFNVANPADVQEMKLRMRYDDGFIAYVNGQEVARRNAPADASWNSAATGLHGSEAGNAGVLVADFDTVTNAFTASTHNAVPGPSIQAAGAGSSGKFIRLLTDGVNNNINAISFHQTVSGVFPLITADFDFRMTDTANNPADGWAFMLIPTSQYGSTGVGLPAAAGVEEPNYANIFAVGFDVYPHASANDVSVHWSATEYANLTIPTSTINLVSGQFHRCSVRLAYVTGGARVTVTITPDINGTPGSPFVAINELFIPGMPQYDCRVEFAGRTGGADMSVDLDNINVRFGHPAGLVPVEEFDLSSAVPNLVAGANLLAIHGLNAAAASPDFLILPELVSRSITVQTNQLFFDLATPGALNERGEAEFAPEPQFSIAGGVFTNNLTVELSSSLPGAAIYYTLDGTPPTEQSTRYTGPIAISSSVMLSAKAYASGYLPSRLASQSYTILESNLFDFTSNLPLVILNTFGKVVRQDMNPRVTASITVIDTSAATGRASLLGKADYHGRAGIEGRGQTSWGFPKKPYNVEIWDENDMDKEVSILGMPAESDYVLLNIHNDKTFLNDFLAHELYEKMGHYAVRRQFVEVFLNGTRPNEAADPSLKVGSDDYVGIYLLLERIKIDNDRVDITGPESGAPGDPITGGYIWKRDKGSPGDVVFTTLYQTSTDLAGESLKYHDPKPEDMTPVQRAWLTNFLNEFETVLYGPNWRDPINGYAKYIDVDTFVDVHWLVEFSKQIDGYRLSHYMQKPRGGKIKLEPIWDWNLSFGNANYLEGGLTNGWYYTQLAAQQHIYLRRLVGDGTAGSGDPDFVQKTIDRWSELRESVLSRPNLLARIDQLTNYLNEAKTRDFNRWPRLKGQAGATASGYYWPNPDGANTASDDGTTATWHVDYCSPGTYAGIIEQMKKWVIGRHAWVDSLYLKRPILSRSSGPTNAPLSMFASVGTIYYTTDGSDPRLSGGALSPYATAYSEPFTPAAGSRIVARVWHTNSWSGPSHAEFGSLPPRIAITEIMYHPAYDGTNFNDEDFEFIELTNPGDTDIDLTGFRLSGGIDFIFPPGQLMPTGSPTTNSFDGGGTAFSSALLGSSPGSTLGVGGPSGNYMKLIQGGVAGQVNRIAFAQTATGNYDKFTADFDFRAVNNTPPPVTDIPTIQNFDDPGSAYVIRSYDADTTTPAVMDADAGSTGKFLRLSKQVRSENGGAFFDTTAAGTNDLVLINFDFRLSGSADGMGVVFMNTAINGTNGAPASGWSEEAGWSSSIGFGFDIYNNANPPTDYNANHVSLHYNNTMVSSPPATPSLNLAAGVFHRAQITIKYEASRALVTLKITPNVNGAGGAPETLYNNFVINGARAYRGRLGFCARTGDAFANHDIDNINVQYLSSMADPGGLSLVMLPAATFGASGQGSALTNYAAAPALTNAFGLNLDMHVLASVNNVNLYWNGTQRGDALVSPAALSLDNGQFHHLHMEAVRHTDGALVTVSLTPDIFGTPGAPITVLSNVLVAGFRPADARVELAARSGGMDLAIDVDNIDVRYHRFASNLLRAGESIVLVNDLAAFQSRYGTSIAVAGEFTGNLNNDGDRIRLWGAHGEPILSFSYNDQWQPLSDGNGFSLVVVNPTGPADGWGLPANWRLSGSAGGSPGITDMPVMMPVPVVINEVLSHSDDILVPGTLDAIELYNPSTTTSADVSGWLLSDNFNAPFKYQLPANTVIPPGGYLVVYETNFANPLSPTSFGLSAEGDEIYLFSSSNGQLTGYYHGFDFGAAEANVTFGRHVISTGDDHFVAQAQTTFGNQNAGPRVGPIVISEIMYHPVEYPGDVDNQDHEFIELFNTSEAAVQLFDPANPGNTWRLTDAVDFKFPANTTIPAGGYLLVVSFDPVTQPDLLASFRAKYGLSDQVVIFGPYQGKLDNSRDRVELRKPGEVDPNTLEPVYILVERISYSDATPWPVAADGSGRSLQRVNLAAYGNDPANWAAGPATPAAPRVIGQAPVITGQPADTTVVAGVPATFTVAATGPEPLTYQWRFKGGNLPGATNATLVLSQPTLADAGEYQVVVMSPAASTDSAVARLGVIQGATILTHPVSQAVAPKVGTVVNVTFNVTALGNGPVTFQWRQNGNPIAGATAPSITISNVGVLDRGIYDVVVTDAIGPVTSSPAELVLLIDPVITQQPESVIIAAGQTLNLTAQVTNTATLPIDYRWRRNGTYVVTNQVASYENTLVWPDIAVINSGTFSVVTANASRTGGMPGANAYVTVVDPPKDQAATMGAPATFTVAVGNPGSVSRRANITVQWFFNGADLQTAIPGATVSSNLATNSSVVILTNTVTIPNVQEALLGSYSVQVSVFTNVTIAPATFTAQLVSGSSVDTDGDGMTDGQEAIAGTDPNDPKSFLAVGITFSGSPVVQFQALANKTYTIEYKEAFQTNAAWQKLADVAAQPAGGLRSIPDPSGSTHRFYRLVTPQR